MVMETQFLDQGFRPETQELSGRRTALNLGFLTGNPEIAGEIQILRQVFRMETQILIVISSPVVTSNLTHYMRYVKDTLYNLSQLLMTQVFIKTIRVLI